MAKVWAGGGGGLAGALLVYGKSALVEIVPFPQRHLGAAGAARGAGPEKDLAPRKTGATKRNSGSGAWKGQQREIDPRCRNIDGASKAAQQNDYTTRPPGRNRALRKFKKRN